MGLVASAAGTGGVCELPLDAGCLISTLELDMSDGFASDEFSNRRNIFME